MPYEYPMLEGALQPATDDPLRRRPLGDQL